MLLILCTCVSLDWRKDRLIRRVILDWLSTESKLACLAFYCVSPVTSLALCEKHTMKGYCIVLYCLERLIDQLIDWLINWLIRCNFAATTGSTELLPDPTSSTANPPFRTAGRSARRRWRGRNGSGTSRRCGDGGVDAITRVKTESIRTIPLATQSLVAHLSSCSGRRQHCAWQIGICCLVWCVVLCLLLTVSVYHFNAEILNWRVRQCGKTPDGCQTSIIRSLHVKMGTLYTQVVSMQTEEQSQDLLNFSL